MTVSHSEPDELDRLFSALVRAIRDQRPEFLASPFAVADLLAFVPYKAVRTEIGVDTNDDYGHAVTRLLAGERGLLFVDDLMQDDLKTELASANPDLQAYRSYLNARVSLAQERVRVVLDTFGPAPPRDVVAPPAGERVPTPPRATAGPPKAPQPVPLTGSGSAAASSAFAASAAEPASMSARASPRERPMAARPRPVPSATASVGEGVAARAPRPGCRYCGQPLPVGRDVRFCPHCGQDLSVHRCGACSAELEPEWKFCVACGRAASA